MEEIVRKSLLYRSGISEADYGINHVFGCSHGCKYPCYAMSMALKFGKVSSYQEWIKPRIVKDALLIVENEIKRKKDKIRSVQLCFATDPFMFQQPEIIHLTLQIIELLNRHDIPISCLTKGVLPLELSDFSSKNLYGISVVSLNERFRKSFEPGTAGYEERIDSLYRLHQKGFKTWVFMEPYPPPQFIKQDINPILEKIAFTDELFFGKLNHNPHFKDQPALKSFYQYHKEIVHNFCKINHISLVG